MMATALRRGNNMATSAIETKLDKLSAALAEMGARHYMKDVKIPNGSVLDFVAVRHTTIIVQIDTDGGFEVFAPVEKTHKLDATIAALKAL
jgi:hypothetical protein